VSISFLKARVAGESHRLIVLFFLVHAFILPGFLYSQPHPVPPDTKCAECGMTVDQNSRFVSEVATKEAKNLFFCDIGDMLIHVRSSRENAKDVYVKDYTTGAWIDGKKALYVLNKKIVTPMSWGIAAFKEEPAAKQWGAPVDFDHAFTLLK
jgi:nitrous oxide reductase accessory protein NosL